MAQYLLGSRVGEYTHSTLAPYFSTRRMSELDDTLYTANHNNNNNAHIPKHRWSVATNQSFDQPNITIQPVIQPSSSWWLRGLFSRQQKPQPQQTATTELQYVTDDTMADIGQLDNDGRVRLSTLDMSAHDVELDGVLNDDSSNTQQKRRFRCVNPFQWTGESRDVYAAILFIVHLFGMIAVAVVYGIQLVNSDNWQMHLYQSPPACQVNLTTDDVYCADLEGFLYVLILIFCTWIGAAWSLLWLKIVQNTYTIMNLTFGLGLALYLTVSVEFFFIRLLPLACGMIVFGLLQIFYIAAVKYKLPFTHAILKTNVEVLHMNPNVLHAAYKLTGIALLWYMVWAFTFTSAFVRTYAVTPDGPQTDPLPGFALFFTLVSLYWSTMVLQYAAQMITSGVIATYMLKPSAHISTKPFIANLFTFSVFGAVCSAAFCTPITEGFRQLVKQTKKFFPSIVPRKVSKLADLGFEYSNHYAVTALACEPTDWTTLSRGTFKLIKDNQLVAECVNRDISGTVCTFAGFVGGMLAAITAGNWASTVGFASQQEFTVLCFLISWCTGSILLSVTQASISTTLMCWATDDAALQGNRPEITAVLNEIVEPTFSRKTSTSLRASFYVGSVADEVEQHMATLKPIDEDDELIQHRDEEKTNDIEQQQQEVFHHTQYTSGQRIVPIWNQSEKAVRARGLDTTLGF